MDENKFTYPGSDEESYSHSCEEILKSNSSKKNGYYYIKTACMPAVKRIYCDM